MENCIQAPEGLQTPSGDAEGSSFQGTFRGYLKDGKLYFRSVNNIPLPGNEDDETSKDEESESDEEQKNEEEMGMEDSPSDDEEDKQYKRKRRDEMTFAKAFNS